MGMILHDFKVLKAGLIVSVDRLHAEPSSWTRIEAPSGFGKTTLLRGLLGLEHAIGEFSLNGKSLICTPTHLRDIGFVFQDQGLFSQKTVFDNVAFGLKVRGYTHAEIHNIVSDALLAVGMEQKIHSPVTDCSGGERQRVALLRALVWKPKLLLLDEPFVGLDPLNRQQTFSFLRKIVGQNPIPVIWISHAPEDLNESVDHRLIGVAIAEGVNQNVRQFTKHNQ